MTDLENILKLVPAIMSWGIMGMAITGLLCVVFIREEEEKKLVDIEKYKKDFNHE